jgi:hypothetical protein
MFSSFWQEEPERYPLQKLFAARQVSISESLYELTAIGQAKEPV